MIVPINDKTIMLRKTIKISENMTLKSPTLASQANYHPNGGLILALYLVYINRPFLLFPFHSFDSILHTLLSINYCLAQLGILDKRLLSSDSYQ